MSVVAIIPARGGSQRIPKKNIKPFAGKPIIAYSIAVAKKSELFHRVIVSTDSEEIAEVSKRYGAEVPFIRPAQLANDHTGTDEVLLHALKWLNENDKAYDWACCIYPTAPFLKAQYLKEGLRLIKENKAVSAFSVTTYHYPIFRSLRINVQERLEMIWSEYYNSRSQDLPETFHDAGQFYWVDVEKYLKGGRIFSKDAVPVILPRDMVEDIDTIEDWELAEQMYKLNLHV